ncbi:MAG: hypothetical protein JRF30_00485 [Deltaproteobacteria bacterium]|nr:hypothetical protein [Deltaproteobacteria bacterium]MBW1794504.1 hypothetical protein [Deltaproteobacteria bacterium]MBW2329429.1 hypothetical protein [Deltaproteobacteria bacterium]
MFPRFHLTGEIGFEIKEGRVVYGKSAKRKKADAWSLAKEMPEGQCFFVRSSLSRSGKRKSHSALFASGGEQCLWLSA